MITIQIGDNWERNLNDVSEHEIMQQINQRRAEGQPVCVRVNIKTDTLNMRLSTPACATTTGGRPPTPQEREIFELWAQRGLDDLDFTGGNLTAFLRQLHHLI